MARPTKQGIDYFPVDTDFDDDLQLFIADTGAEGLGILVTIWQAVYKGEGYYISYDKKFPLKIKQKCFSSAETIINVVTKAIEYEIFDNEMYKKHKILTSNGLQKRFFPAARLKKEVKIIPKYMLIDVSSVENGVNVVGNGVNAVGNATNVKGKVKVKENIYNFWNDQKIIIHKKLTSKTNTAIKSALKDYSKSEILKAIENYKTVLTSENHYWTHKWGLLDFLNRGLRKFIDAADPLGNYKNNGIKPVNDGSDIKYI